MRRRTGTTTVTGMALAAVMVLGLTGCGLRDDRAEPLDPGSTLAATTTTGAAATTPSTTVPVAGCTTTTAQPTTHVYDQIAGVDPELLSLDVYGLPEGCGPSPVVFYVHGGAWRIGDKSTPSTRTKADWAAANGWTLVSVNYRLSTEGSGVVWPTHGEDVATAIAWTLDHADELGIDPERVAVTGHSAGAHIASMIAVDPSLLGGVGLDREDVDCLVSLDTEGYDIQERIDTSGEATDEVFLAVFGTDPLAQADASPLVVLGDAGGPVADAAIVTRGTPTRQAQAQAFADLLTANGSEVELIRADGYSHAEVNAALGQPGETVETPAITGFLQRCLA